MDKISHYYERFITYMEENHHLHISRQTKEEKWLMPHIRLGCRVDYGMGRALLPGRLPDFEPYGRRDISLNGKRVLCRLCDHGAF